MLTDDQITEVLGEHDGGQHDYALGGCSFGEGTTFSRNRGELWFACGDQWCGIAAGTFYADDRESIAVELAHSLEGRL